MKKVLITGGSEGIGLAFAKEYAKQKYHLFLAARSRDKLEKAAADIQHQYDVPVTVISCDLSETGTAEKLFAELEQEEIDVLINNAGCGYAGEALKIDAAAEKKMIQLNISSLVTLTKLFGAQMTARNSGTIVNVASTGAFQPGPYIASYYASKSFVLSYTRALKEELKNTNVQIYCLCPGPVDTGFYQKSGGVMSRCHISPEACAAYAVRHMHNHAVLIPDALNRFLIILPSGLKMKWLAGVKKKNLK